MSTPKHKLHHLGLIGLGLSLSTSLACTSAEELPGMEDSGSSSDPDSSLADEPSLQVSDVVARYAPELDALVFEMTVEGDAGSVVPTAVGGVDGAPVLGYVFPTTLEPADVGFEGVEGTVALGLTSHPDFDDTPLWDEDNNERYDDDGVVYHAHWVVLVDDADAPGGLAVASSPEQLGLPPTAPMPMYLDSPGFTVVEDGSQIRVIVPSDRVHRHVDFEVGALTAMMRVDASGEVPVLRVERVFSALDDGAPTTAITGASAAPVAAWPLAGDDPAGLILTDASGNYDPSVDTFVLSLNVEGMAATNVPEAAGGVDGAPVLGYVFPTSISPRDVGFEDIDGILALAVTSHPDFDDTPYWDEGQDGDYQNDGAVYHVHWAVLIEDTASPGGFTVPSAEMEALPPTAPMPMYLDSPGYHAFAVGDALHVLIPGWHIPNVDSFSFDALTARMRVDAGSGTPVLRVEEVVDLFSDDLSLPLSVSRD